MTRETVQYLWQYLRYNELHTLGGFLLIHAGHIGPLLHQLSDHIGLRIGLGGLSRIFFARAFSLA